MNKMYCNPPYLHANQDNYPAVLEGAMTLRDHFAACVMLSCFEHCATTEDAAKSAYEAADAMMEARK